MDFFNVVSIDEARKIIDESFSFHLGEEEVELSCCLGRILRRDLVSDADVPGFRRSTVDGYAVNSRDVFGASESMPSMMDLKGEVRMGEAPAGGIALPGECFYVPTGGMLPEGADSVVMIEYTDKLDSNTILVNSPVAPGDNIIDAGEDIRKGAVVIEGGTRIRPYEAGVMSSLGFTRVSVYKKPRVAVISTGDEVIPPEDMPGPGQVRDINTYLLHSLVQESGGEPVNFGIIDDDYDSLKKAVENALSQCDIVLISGGSSVGKKDQTLKVMESFSQGSVLIHGLSVKPGKPTIIGKAADRIVFGLPGHPLACAVIYKALVDYCMNKMMNHSEIKYPLACKFAINYHKAKGREEYLPVTIQKKGGELWAHPVFGKSGLITGFSQAWGYIDIEKNLEGLIEGQTVEAYEF
jgi:molybdopterin molybdotransferase